MTSGGAAESGAFMLTQAIENLLNRNLPRSPRAQELCESLKGKRARIEARGPGWVLECESLGSSVRLARGGEAASPADCEIAGSLMNLAALAGSQPEAVIQRGDVTIRGDAEIAQKFRELAMLLRPDVEEELSKLIGDTPAHQALRFVKLATGFGRRAATTGVRNVAEYFAHESRDLVPRAEAEDFYRGVERLREDLDRLDARTRLLEPVAEDPTENSPR
jgi:ubiquinone biosynthesis protein UbiJ